MTKLKVLILIGWMFLFSTNAFSGWIFTENSEGDIQMTYVQNNKIKFVNPEQITIFKLNENNLSFINPKDKTYWSGTPEQFVENAQKSIAMMEKQLDEQLAKLPPEQRASVQKALKSQKQTPPEAISVDLKQTDQTSEMIGYQVRKYEILVKGILRQEQWITTAIPINKEINPDKFRKFLISLKTDAFRSDQLNITLLPKTVELLNKGWPLKRTDYDEDGYPETEETIKVENMPLPESTFEIPEHYRRISLMELYGK